MNDKVCKIAEVQLSYKSKIKPCDRHKITNSDDAFKIFLENWDKDSIEYVKEFKILLLNRANMVLGIANISKGGIFGTVTDVRIILQYAIKTCACGLILCHNHPSGNIEPSNSDRAITRKVKESCSLMDVQLLDHIIITVDGMRHSFADNGDL
jgi:DNA repair protein RadC